MDGGLFDDWLLADRSDRSYSLQPKPLQPTAYSLQPEPLQPGFSRNRLTLSCSPTESVCPVCGTPNPRSAFACSGCGAQFAVNSAPHVLGPGARLAGGGYTIIGLLGQGGFGITYLGIDVRLGRQVAIKEFFPSGCVRQGTTVLPSGSWGQASFGDAMSRFVEEGRTLALFSHPGIVQAFNSFEENGTGYVVMEYVQGKTLAQLLTERGGRLDEEEAVRCVTMAGRALEAVHAAGVLHRDLKPGNIMVTEEGRVVLLDFGAAREYALGVTQSHTVVLTPGYAPLEQYASHARRGAYSDVYSLAATLYSLLTGEAPVAATDRATGSEIRPVRMLNPLVSERVERAISAGLEMNVEARPASVRAFMDALSGSDGARCVSPTLNRRPSAVTPARLRVSRPRYGWIQPAAGHPGGREAGGLPRWANRAAWCLTGLALTAAFGSGGAYMGGMPAGQGALYGGGCLAGLALVMPVMAVFVALIRRQFGRIAGAIAGGLSAGLGTLVLIRCLLDLGLARQGQGIAWWPEIMLVAFCVSGLLGWLFGANGWTPAWAAVGLITGATGLTITGGLAGVPQDMRWIAGPILGGAAGWASGWAGSGGHLWDWGVSMSTAASAGRDIRTAALNLAKYGVLGYLVYRGYLIHPILGAILALAALASASKPRGPRYVTQAMLERSHRA